MFRVTLQLQNHLSEKEVTWYNDATCHLLSINVNDICKGQNIAKKQFSCQLCVIWYVDVMHS